MSRDTHDQTKYSDNVKTCDQLRQTHDYHNEPTVQTIVLEKNKGEGQSADKPGVIRSVHSINNPRALLPSNGDLRRNLYVLGLPFDLTKSDFVKIFESYGSVTHAVILATLDSASRRRGFVVMSTHQAAKTAMGALSNKQIKGHMLDVSWAVIQRSQGFLDGADRTMMLAISTPSIPETNRPYNITGRCEDQINQWELTHTPTSKLLVSNLSTVLFTQVADLHPLFYPFGAIKDIKVLGSSSVGSLDATTIAAMVEYVNASSAKEAKEALQFQSYAGHPIGTYYVCDTVATYTRQPPSFSGSPLCHGKPSDIGLNPFAMPFKLGSRFPTGSKDQSFNSRFNPAVSTGPPSDAPLAPQPFPAHMRPYVTDAISRSSSATSSAWSHDGHPLRPSRICHSSVNRTNTYASYA